MAGIPAHYNLKSMANVISPPEWRRNGWRITPESVFWNRRAFLQTFGAGAAGFASRAAFAAAPEKPTAAAAKRNPAFNDPKLIVTAESVATSYNNFYEFSTGKTRVAKLVDKFIVDPWSVAVGGLCEKPAAFDLDALARLFPLEERVYRFRCVEAWSMVIPWTGFPLRLLLEKVAPKSDAKFVKFTSANKPDQMPGISRLSEYPWPYTEGLRMAEAMHDLTLVVTGVYGKPLPKQNGAPIRIIVPWKYGYKSPKSIVKIELTDRQPATLWESLSPVEYPFESNVDPAVPHPRWSQASERVVETGDYIPTLKLNGYADQVGSLYAKR
jgi:methionine sulfoxide reductase catalytic subunit